MVMGRQCAGVALGVCLGGDVTETKKARNGLTPLLEVRAVTSCAW